MKIEVEHDHYVSLMLDRMKLQLLEGFRVNELPEWKKALKNFNEEESLDCINQWTECNTKKVKGVEDDD